MTKRFWGFKRLGTTRDARDEIGLRCSFSGWGFRSKNGGRTHSGTLEPSSEPVGKRPLQRPVMTSKRVRFIFSMALHRRKHDWNSAFE